MGFQFALSTVLRIREAAEQREEHLLGQIAQQIAQGRQTLCDIETQRRIVHMQLEEALRQTASGFDVRGLYEQLHQLDALEIAGKEHLVKLAVLRQQQMKVYEAAYRNRELLSVMKERQLQEFRRQVVRQEQNAVDDIFSSRRR